MDAIIKRIDKAHFWTFHGGIHPPEQKHLTNDKPIRTLPLPNELIIPLQQHVGEAGKLLVAVGDTVLKGQALTQYSNAMAIPVHAPTSGTVTAIKNATIAHPSGMAELCLFLTPDGNDTWKKRTICTDYTQLSAEQIVDKIIQAGIAGMGGAGFPTHIKVTTPNNIDTLIINAAECEPYITSDDLLLREYTDEVVDGINILNKLLQPNNILIGIEDNKPKAIDALKEATQQYDNIRVCVIPTKYPSGSEKQLIKILTGKEVPKGALPNSLGIVMQNVGTCFAIADAVIHDIPLIKRVVTVTGHGLEKPQNVWALLGTPVEHLLSLCGYQNSQQKHLIMGGPMMGFSLASAQVPVVKTSNCILAYSEAEISQANEQKKHQVACIRCGECASVCPSQLLPQELQWAAKAKDHSQLNRLHLFDCIECGACAYVCPSQIPLVSYYRIAKAEIHAQKLDDLKAEKAKARFEARKRRLEREKEAREQRHKQAAEARKARMNADTPEAQNEKSAVAAALARVKAKKAQQQNQAGKTGAQTKPALTTDNAPTSDAKQQVVAAIARAKAKKRAQQAQMATEHQTNKSNKSSENIAKEDNLVTKSNETVSTQKSNTNKPADRAPLTQKEKIAAAVAKAKAKKQALATEELTPVVAKQQQAPSDSAATDARPKTTANEQEDDKKARIAAAVAKAKAKKIAQAKEKMHSKASPSDAPKERAENEIKPATTSNSTANTATVAENELDEKALEKKARIAAAVAKAKAKKQQRSESN